MKIVKFYRNIYEINVYIFFKILDTKNYNFLVKKYVEKSEFNLSEKQLEIAKDLFQDIVNDFNESIADKNMMEQLKAKAEIQYLECVYKSTLSCLKIYEETRDIEILFFLKELDWKIDPNKDIEEQFIKILSRMKSLKMKIKIRKINYDKKYNKQTKKDENKSFISGLPVSALNIQQSLDLKYPIDVTKTKLSHWCELVKLTKLKAINNGK